ncbi:MAG: Rnase Y domain-containing protein, partial [Dehalococcoidia bacterium]|nr:Rnase Y domain-containing protein [Dehalococcoidia bacterium]
MQELLLGSIIGSIVVILAIFVIGVVFGGLLTFLTRRVLIGRQMRIAERRAARTVAEARLEAKGIVQEAKQEVDKSRASTENEARQRRAELQRQENRTSQKSDSLDRKLEAVENRERNLNNKEKEVESVRAGILEIKGKQLKQLELISGMSSEDAKKMLLATMEGEIKEEAARRLRVWEAALRQQENEKAQEILSRAIQRYASDVVSESTVSVVPIPNDEMKGRLIGREGRNIRALEQATGVDLIIDDTPEAVTVSSFDPVRREVARQALKKLILDGRIHPARIEEVVNKTKEEVEAA